MKHLTGLTGEELLETTGKTADELTPYDLGRLGPGPAKSRPQPDQKPVEKEQPSVPAAPAAEQPEKEKYKKSFFRAIEEGDVKKFIDMATLLHWNLFPDQIDRLLDAILTRAIEGNVECRWDAVKVVKAWPSEKRVRKLREKSDSWRWDLPPLPGEQVWPSETILERTERLAAEFNARNQSTTAAKETKPVAKTPTEPPSPPSPPPPPSPLSTKKTGETPTPPAPRMFVRRRSEPDPEDCEQTADGLRRDKRRREHGPEGSQFGPQPQGKPQGHRTPIKPRWSPEVSLAKAAGMGVEESLVELRRSGKVLAGLAAGRDRTG